MKLGPPLTEPEILADPELLLEMLAYWARKCERHNRCKSRFSERHPEDRKRDRQMEIVTGTVARLLESIDVEDIDDE